MSLKLLYGDISNFICDAVILPSKSRFLSGIHSAENAADIPEGQAKSMDIRNSGFLFRCNQLIVTAAPKHQNGNQNALTLLSECYRSGLDEAVKSGCCKVGISLIENGLPEQEAIETAVQSILEYPAVRDMEVFLIPDKPGHNAVNTFRKLDLFLGNRLAPDPFPMLCAPNSAERPRKSIFRREKREFAGMAACESAVSLDERLKQLDEGFTEMLFRKIDEAGIKDSECYKKANVSKQLFSKIRSDSHYRPKKETVLAFALALRLNLDDTNALLRTAGYSLSHSSKFDIIIEYFIIQGIYNVFEINEALYRYDQPVLGSE